MERKLEMRKLFGELREKFYCHSRHQVDGIIYLLFLESDERTSGTVDAIQMNYGMKFDVKFYRKPNPDDMEMLGFSTGGGKEEIEGYNMIKISPNTG